MRDKNNRNIEIIKNNDDNNINIVIFLFGSKEVQSIFLLRESGVSTCALVEFCNVFVKIIIFQDKSHLIIIIIMYHRERI